MFTFETYFQFISLYLKINPDIPSAIQKKRANFCNISKQSKLILYWRTNNTFSTFSLCGFLFLECLKNLIISQQGCISNLFPQTEPDIFPHNRSKMFVLR